MVQSVYKMTNDEVVGCRLIESSTHIGLFNFSSTHGNKLKRGLRRLFKTIVVSKYPLSKTRLLLIRVGKLGIKLYNYNPQFSFHKNDTIYGIHLLFLRLTWNRF